MSGERLDNTPNRLMRICFSLHSSVIGGAEKSLVELIIALEERGIYCMVIFHFYGHFCEGIKNLDIDF